MFLWRAPRDYFSPAYLLMLLLCALQEGFATADEASVGSVQPGRPLNGGDLSSKDFQGDLVNPLLIDAYVEAKRAPSGFLGMRGKKFNENLQKEIFDSEMKRAPYGFLGMRGKKAPSGFLGMRGKKNQGDVEYIFTDPELEEVVEEIEKSKRVPSGFLGMRGKKYPPVRYSDLKRARLSQFLGMRG